MVIQGLCKDYIGGYVGIIFNDIPSVMENQTAEPMEHDMKTLGPSNRIYRGIWGLGVGDSNGKEN